LARIFLLVVACNIYFFAGQLDSTMLIASARNSNLLAILSDDKMLAEIVQDLTKTLESIRNEDLQGFQLSEFLNAPGCHIGVNMTRQALKPEYFELLSKVLTSLGQTNIRNEILSLDRISFRGVYYGTFQSQHYRDSAIIFRVDVADPPEGNESAVLAGIISMICEYECRMQGSQEVFKRLFLFVNEHLSVQKSRPGFHDPYRKYGFAAGFICEEQAEILHLIDLTQIVSHFALTTLPNEKLIHVLPVDRVSFHLYYTFDLLIGIKN
jgi:hypothetical protein